MAARVPKKAQQPNYDRQRAIWISLGLAVVVFALYAQVRNFGFIGYDDPEFVAENLHLRGGLTAASITWAFRTGYAANWFPLTWISYLIGVSLYGLDPSWHHLSNVLLHAINTVLLFLVLRRMTGALWRSAVVALLFGVHPLHVEAVAWISERRELLSGLFWFLSIWAYLDYIRRPRAPSYALLLLAFACGLMSKPMIVTLPFALLLLDYWPLRRWESTPPLRLLLEKAPLVALAAAGSLITLLVQQGGGAVSSLAEVPPHLRVENALISYVAYVAQFLWPARLAVLYPYPSGLPVWQVVGAGAMLAAITALAIAQRRQRPYVAVGWLWFAGILVPVIGLVQVGVQSRADRYMYIPLVGLAVMTVWGIAEIGRRRGLVLGAVACCAYGAVAWTTESYWSDTVALFRHTVEVTHDNWAAMLTLSHALLQQNRVDEAWPYVNQAIALRPNLAEARINFGAALSERGEFDSAANQYRAALQSDPGNPDAEEGLGVTLTQRGQLAEALPHLTAALKRRPDDADAHYNLGRVYGMAARPDLAAAEFSTAIQLQPGNASAHFNLGAAYAAQDQLPQACDQFREALRLKPDYLAAHFNLASGLANLERYDEAIAEFQEVLRLQPGNQDAARALEECRRLKQQSQR